MDTPTTSMPSNTPYSPDNRMLASGHYIGDDEHAVLLARVTDLKNVNISYICASCGGFAYVPLVNFTSFDSGTTLTCDKCGGHTVIELRSSESYAKEKVMPCGHLARYVYPPNGDEGTTRYCLACASFDSQNRYET